MPSPRRRRLELRALLRLRATRLLAAGVLLVAGALGLSATLTLSHALSPETFAALASDGLGREIRVASVRFDVLGSRGRPRLRAEGVEIEGLGTAGAAELEVRVRPLVRGRVHLSAVRLEAPRLVLHRGPDGAFLPLFGAGTGGGGSGLETLPVLEADGGEIRVVQGPKLDAVVRLAAFHLGRHRDGFSRLVVAGNLTGGDGRWHAHPLHLRGRLVATEDGIVLRHGRARARHVGAAWWSGSDARARFAYRDGRLVFESVEVRSFGGTWRLAGTAWLRGGMRLDVTARADGVDVASLSSAANGRGPETDADLGVLHMRWTSLRVPWHGGPRFEEGRGAGTLRVVGGTLPGAWVLGSLVGLDAAPTPVESFSSPVELREARLHSDGLRLVTGDYVLEAAGSVGLDRSVALEGRVDLAGDLLLPRGASLLPSFPVTIAGLLPRPEVDAHMGRLPAHGIGAVAGAVQKTGETVVEGTLAAGRAVGRGLGAVGRKVGDLFGR